MHSKQVVAFRLKVDVNIQSSLFDSARLAAFSFCRIVEKFILLWLINQRRYTTRFVTILIVILNARRQQQRSELHHARTE